jgi:hypothetical protein
MTRPGTENATGPKGRNNEDEHMTTPSFGSATPERTTGPTGSTSSKRDAPSGQMSRRPQMGGADTAPQPQQASELAPAPGTAPRPAVRFTDWASI